MVRPMSSGRRLRVLFFLGGPSFYQRQYASLIAELADRGHSVHLAFQRSKGDLPAAARPSGDRVTYGFAPERERTDGWRTVAWMVRGLADLARYAHPRFERATLLRARMEEKIVGHLTKSDELEPIGRRIALRLAGRLTAGPDAALSERVIRACARLETAIPASARIVEFVRGQAPDVVLATPVVNRASTQVEFLKAARRLGIPAATCVASWDNLSNKGLLKFMPERVFVWNEVQRREAVDLHGIPADRVVATGAQLFDHWFAREPSSPREEFVRAIGLDPARPYVLYTCSNPAMTEVPESGFVHEWVGALRASDDELLRGVGVAIRPHPNDEGQWDRFEASRFENVVVWPRRGELPVTAERQSDFFDSLVHCAAVVGINTTAMIEAAIVGKSVLTVLSPEFAQESTLHFDYLLAENGGFLHVADSLPEHAEQLRRALSGGTDDAERRRRFVEAFVRPHGLDRPAAPILADAVEELATLPVERRTPAAALVLRAPLALEAVLVSLAVRLGDLRRSRGRKASRRRLRGLARPIIARVRRVGAASPRSGG